MLAEESVCSNTNEINEDNKTTSDDEIEEWIPLYKRKQMEKEERSKRLNPIKRRRLQHYEEEIYESSSSKNQEKEIQTRPTKSLLDQKVEMLKNKPIVTPKEEELKQAQELVDTFSQYDRPLKSVSELANNIEYTDPMPSNWKAAGYLYKKSHQEHENYRKNCHIITEGENIPPPCERFVDMKLPNAIIHHLASKGITKPTPIQIQGLPVILSGRDMIGIAFTGSGKTLVFCLPLVLIALQHELKLPFGPGEGPVGIIVCPSRELARQTFEVIEELTLALKRDGAPHIRCLLCIGGLRSRDQAAEARRGIHIIVATPGRLVDMLDKKKFNLDNCKYLAMDEADRMIDQDFEEEMRNVMNHFKHQRQTLLFSATMPAKLKAYAKSALVQPIVVNVGRAGAANLDVVQEVEEVKNEAKITYLLECLQKTAPPVLIFCENKRDVDDIYEYLLLKGVEVASIHGDKDQEERNEAIKFFKNKQKDVLVATDVASKGLDFPDIKHVINFDMPKAIEDYVHRIGRTGRCGKTGVATTFINTNNTRSVLLDLKHLLIEAKQRIPLALLSLEDDVEVLPGESCPLCNGLGHRVAKCPKFQQPQRAPRTNDFLRD